MRDGDRIGVEVAAAHPKIREALLTHGAALVTLDDAGRVVVGIPIPSATTGRVNPRGGCLLCCGSGQVLEDEVTRCPRCGGTGG